MALLMARVLLMAKPLMMPIQTLALYQPCLESSLGTCHCSCLTLSFACGDCS